ncbi:MAG: hypothetical protein JXB35_11170 [Anaerolineae bacterium]|nr:hypothetical protein [Anaerolineae bacterium]
MTQPSRTESSTKRASRIVATTLGGLGALLGMAHGVFEILQGNRIPGGVMINAIGPPCQAETTAHACWPAMTLIPNFRITGVVAVLVALAVLIWATALVHKKHGGVILIALSLAMIPVGGGFIPAFYGVFGGIAGTRIRREVAAGSTRKLEEWLARFWPGPLILLVVWQPVGWILGELCNEAMLSLSGVLFLVFDIALPLLSVFTGWARDRRA